MGGADGTVPVAVVSGADKMGLSIRKFAVGFAALIVLAGIFLLYVRYDRTPPIVLDVARPASVAAADANRPQTQETVGTIVGVRVGSVRETEFLHRDETGRIDRRFGFHELLHEQGDQWEITKPYMDLFLPAASCRVTADCGRVQIDDVLGRPMTSDAMFTGNVVIHLTPTDSNNPWECFIHLDDVGFLAEKSLFSSTGAVRFLSRDVRLDGAGMELVYNASRSRVELFRIFDLDSLRLRSSEVRRATGVGSPGSEGRVADLPATEKDSSELSSADSRGRGAASTDSNAPPVDVYQCVFRKNVRLESPDGAVLAKDVLAINNIQWSRRDEPAPAPLPAVDPNEPEPVAPPVANALNTTASSHVAMSSIPEELFDVVVTCDGGADITLTNSPDGIGGRVMAGTGENPPSEIAPEEIASSDRQQVVARRIDYDFCTNDAIMLGPVAMSFAIDPNRLGERAGGEPMPAVVTAQKAVRFLAASKQAVLEGDCTAMLRKSEPNANDEYRLAAPRLTLDLVIDSNMPGDVKVDVRKFVADEGEKPADSIDSVASPPVAVRMWRRVSDKLLGWGALDARELQYDADPGRFMASGPGMIWLHNNATVQSKDDPNVILEPCYVRLSNFDTLTYWSLSKRIVAGDDEQQLRVNYFPLVEEKPGPETQVVAGHVEATLREIAPGRMDLVSLVASKGIEYDSEADHHHFAGSEMVYDHARSLMTIRGDAVRPCYLNGVLVDEILLNPRTGRVEAQVPTATVFQVGP